jgi:hypothetical protein
MTTRSLNMSDRRIDDGGLGRPTNLREIRQESGKIKETTVEGLSTLSFDGIVSCTALCGISAPAGFAFDLS